MTQGPTGRGSAVSRIYPNATRSLVWPRRLGHEAPEDAVRPLWNEWAVRANAKEVIDAAQKM